MNSEPLPWWVVGWSLRDGSGGVMLVSAADSFAAYGDIPATPANIAWWRCEMLTPGELWRAYQGTLAWFRSEVAEAEREAAEVVDHA